MIRYAAAVSFAYSIRSRWSGFPPGCCSAPPALALFPDLMKPQSSRSLRRAYLDWVDNQIEDFKETIPRSDLLRLADEVVDELRVTQKGQYQLTELLLCTAVDRKIFRLLKLPKYRSWCTLAGQGVRLDPVPISCVE